MNKKPLLPLLGIFLTLTWLLLNSDWSFGQFVLGVLFATLISLAITRLRPLPAWPRRLQVAIVLLFHVIIDISRSNIAVAGFILHAHRHQPQSGFLQIPLDLRDPHGMAILSMIITATPGTVWAGHDAEHNVVTLHILDLQNKAIWAQTIKQRYEQPLMEIFR